MAESVVFFVKVWAAAAAERKEFESGQTSKLQQTAKSVLKQCGEENTLQVSIVK